MSLKDCPITPHRPLYARSMSARRASPGIGYSISTHGSPRTSVEDFSDSPSVPATPADINNARVTPKVWPASRLESISESSVPGVGSHIAKSKSAEFVTATNNKLANLHLTNSMNAVGYGMNNKIHGCDDPFTSDASPLEKRSFSRSFETVPSAGVGTASPTNGQSASFQGTMITDENAQALLPPGACIFVANLPRDMYDAALHEQVKAAFSKYGDCWVKIRRNASTNTPHAFVQYASAEHAGKAVALGRNTRIGGRGCRTEMAVAPRILFVFRKDKTIFPQAVIYELLGAIGEIAEISEPSFQEASIHRLPPGYFVKMALYQAALSVLGAYRQNPIWNVVPREVVAPARKESPRGTAAVMNHPALAVSSNYHPFPSSFGPIYECLWVGEIPLCATFYSFIRLIISHGPINQIETCTIVDPAPTKCSAWIWFMQPGLVARAAHALNGLRFHDCILQAEYVVRSPQASPSYMPAQLAGAASFLHAQGP